ncbi:unnamed protein product [Trichogramma brassicae]|uniref:Thioredoxin-like protein n=1 Tax=Trichogramma brassicae TaxID=86971 RepID=A0A6H5ITW7_9HYME|nr:unnamed protein product [Trichogramma brassicae]
MSFMLQHLENGWQVDQAIASEEDLHENGRSFIAEKVQNFAVIYLVDLDIVGDFTAMYELYDPCTVMFFFRNRHIMIDLGTGNNNKINWALEDKQEMIDILETVYKGARKGRGVSCIAQRLFNQVQILIYVHLYGKSLRDHVRVT